MRVLLVMTAREIGGAELYAGQLVAALRDRCAFTVAISDHLALASLREALGEMARVVPLPVDRPSALPSVTVQLRRMAAKHDVVQLISNHPASRLGILMGFALSGAGAPLIVVEQRATLIEDVKAPAALAPILPALFRRSRRGAARVIAVSEENRRTLETTYGLPPNAVEVVHNGVDLSRFAGPASDALRDELRLEREGPIVLTVSRLLPNKGHDDLIAAAPAILSRFPGAHFVFAGDGDQRAALEAQIEALHLRDHFSLLGFRTDVPDLMRGSDLFVLPSLAEGFSLALVEALAAGLPVVATRVGGAEEAIEDGRNGFLAPPADPAVLAAAVTRVLEMEPAGRRALSKAARGSARRFSVEAMAERMFAIYREVSNAARN